MTPLTPRQREVLDYLGAFHARDGRFPTGPEIAAHFGFRDPSPAYQHLDTLEAKGYLRIKRYGYGRPRAIQFTTQATADIMTADNLADRATRIETIDGHVIQKSGGWWYAYPKLDDGSARGGAVLTQSGPAPNRGSVGPLRRFATASEALTACDDAVTRWGGQGTAAKF